ncbi:MAG TPA: tetratricopeptide repeat protein [Gemmataceae bacterium]|nr:tetratricopeptide repeat protein [Gemmataceae bacterium]
MELAEAMARAKQAHQAGQWQHAESLYQQVLAADPTNADALHLLGVLAYQAGQHQRALDSIQQALAIRPHDATFHSNRGLVLDALGRLEEAAACYREALRLRPNDPVVHNNLGKVLARQGRLNDAVACFREALRLRPNYPEAHRNLNMALQKQEPPSGDLARYHEAIRLLPGAPEAHYNLALALQRQDRLDEAVASYRQAIRLCPDYHRAHHNLGHVLQRQDRLDEAVACFREAVRCGPDSAESHYNLGNAYHCQGHLDEAMACYREAIRLRPDYPEAHHNLGQCWLLLGQFERGWAEYEWHGRCPGIPTRTFRQPLWDGTPLGGRTILLYADQGLGDNLQFARYAPLVQQRGGTVIMECLPALAPLLATCPGIDRLVPRGSPLPEFAVQAPMLSLPGILRTTVNTIPAAVPYLHPDPQRRRRWQQVLQETPTFNVGIAWQGRPTHGQDRQRSVALEQFGALAEGTGVRLVRLQRGPGSEQLARLDGRWAVFDPPDWPEDPAEAWLESAALVSALDLVVTVDTSVAHLAGALATPVWVALPFLPDWRWLLQRDDSPWYPSMRLFRQEHRGDWSGVFARIREALRHRLGESGPRTGG